MVRKRKTLGLVLGAGGARGACHVGVIEALKENSIPIDYIAGSSMGAVVGGAFASGTDIYEMEKRLLELKMIDLLDLNLLPLSSGGLLRGKASEKLIAPFLKCENVEDTLIPYRSTAVDLIGGSLYVFKKGSLLTAIRASMSIPGIFEPVKYEGKVLVDGGVLARLPVETMTEEFHPDVTLIVDALGRVEPLKNHKYNILTILMRSFEISDFAHTRKYYEDETCFLLEPNMGDLSQITVKTIPASIESGRQVVVENLAKIKKMLGIKK
jgi:NTE family protein